MCIQPIKLLTARLTHKAEPLPVRTTPEAAPKPWWTRPIPIHSQLKWLTRSNGKRMEEVSRCSISLQDHQLDTPLPRAWTSQPIKRCNSTKPTSMSSMESLVVTSLIFDRRSPKYQWWIRPTTWEATSSISLRITNECLSNNSNSQHSRWIAWINS